MRRSTGRISSRNPSTPSSPSPSSIPSPPSLGIAIDWLPDDTLLVAASVIVKVFAEHPTPTTSSSSSSARKDGRTPSVAYHGSRRVFDLALTSLAAEDLFKGGYGPSHPHPHSPQSIDASKNKTSSSSSSSSSSRVVVYPVVSVYRGLSNDLTGLKGIPSSPSFTPSDASSNTEAPVVSALIWAGPVMMALTFPSGGTNRADLRGELGDGCVAVHAVEAVYLDSAVSKGSYLSVDMVHYSVDESDAVGECERGSPRSTSSHSHSSSLAVHANPMGLPPKGQRHTKDSTVARSHSTLAAVDSLGNVNMAIIPHSALHLHSAEGVREDSGLGPRTLSFPGSYVRFSSANNSGTFRTLSLSIRSPSSHSDCPSYCLTLASPCIFVKVFSVTVVEGDSVGKAPAFYLSLLYKVNTSFPPSYLLSLPLMPRTGSASGSTHWTPDVLVVTKKGDMGFLTAGTSDTNSPPILAAASTSTCTAGQLRVQNLDPEFLWLRSALSPLCASPSLLEQSASRSQVRTRPHSSHSTLSSLSMVTCHEARLTAILCRGKLQLIHANSGVQVQVLSRHWPMNDNYCIDVVPSLLYSTLLYSPLLYFTLLCSPPLYSTVLSSPLRKSTLLSSPLLSSTSLFSALLHSTVLSSALLHSTLLSSTLLYSTALSSTLLYSPLLSSTLLSSALPHSTLLCPPPPFSFSPFFSSTLPFLITSPVAHYTSNSILTRFQHSSNSSHFHPQRGCSAGPVWEAPRPFWW